MENYLHRGKCLKNELWITPDFFFVHECIFSRDYHHQQKVIATHWIIIQMTTLSNESYMKRSIHYIVAIYTIFSLFHRFCDDDYYLKSREKKEQIPHEYLPQQNLIAKSFPIRIYAFISSPEFRLQIITLCTLQLHGIYVWVSQLNWIQFFLNATDFVDLMLCQHFNVCDSKRFCLC